MSYLFLIMLLCSLPIWAEPLDLSQEGVWEILFAGGERCRLGQRLAYGGFFSEYDPRATGSIDPTAGSTTYAWGESEQVETAPPSCLTWTDSPKPQVWSGLQRGHLVWMRTTLPGSQLIFQKEPVGLLAESLKVWEQQLGSAISKVTDAKHVIYLYRATMADIGLEVEEGKVVAFVLIEPGQLRVHLLRREYREL